MAQATHCDPRLADYLAGSLGSGLIAVDTGGRVSLLNAAAQRILGLPGPADSLLGCEARYVLGATPAIADRLVEALDGRPRPGRVELILECSGEADRTIGYSLTAIRDPAGTLRGAAMQFRDLTPIERRAAQERLRERLAALGEMAAGLAHEIRNPLAAMEISAGLLKRRLRDDPDALALLDEVRGELARVAQTVTQSLEFVRPIALEPAWIDPVALLEESLSLARARAGYRGSLERHYPIEAPPPLRVDGEGLQAALTNLILNAFEALRERRPAEQRVEVGIDCAAPSEPSAGVGGPRACPELVFRVADNGPGIPAELRERIFYPFFTTKEGGSGVGLATAQKLVAEHGGRLEVESDAVSGTTFRIHLPAGPEHPDRRRAA